MVYYVNDLTLAAAEIYGLLCQRFSVLAFLASAAVVKR